MNPLFNLLVAAVFTVLGTRAGGNIGAIFCAFIALYNIEPVIRKLTRVELSEQILARMEVRTATGTEAPMVREAMKSDAKRDLDRGARAAFAYAYVKIAEQAAMPACSAGVRASLEAAARMCADWSGKVPTGVFPDEYLG